MPLLAGCVDGGADGQEDEESQCPAAAPESLAHLPELAEGECGVLEWAGIKPNHTVKPFWLDRCLGGGTFHEVWLVRRLDACDAPPAVLKIPASKVGHMLNSKIVRRLLRGFLLKTECGTTKVLSQRDPEHFVDCFEQSKLMLDHGELHHYTLLSIAPGRNLRKWRHETPKEPPRVIPTLASVFDMTLRMFELMDKGIRPELYGQANVSFRYYLHDLNIGNIMITEDGRNLTVIDNDRTAFCCISAENCDLSLGISSTWDRRECGPLIDRFHKESMVAKLFETLLTLLTVPPQMPMEMDVIFFIEDIVRDSIIPFPMLGTILRWCCDSFWRNVWQPLRRHTGEAMEAYVQDFVDYMLGRLRPAYFKDWQRVDAAALVGDAARTVYKYDVTWPPDFIARLREMRRELG